MRIIVSGSTGLIGSALVPFLTTAGHDVTKLVRSGNFTGAVQWNPEAGMIDRPGLEGCDAVVHLAGENIAARRWTAAQKARIRDSRVTGTRLLSEALAALAHPPKVLVSASAIGYYGDRGDEVLREDSAPGTGFLADTCRQWESSTDPVTRKGIRVVHIRTGIVLSSSGGALGKMVLPFKMGVGGKIGSGRQYMSWITLSDLCAAILHCIQAGTLHGAVNTVSPTPVTNLEFTKTLGRVLSRPTIFPLPAFAARIVLGEMADGLLLASARVEPAKLLATRFGFQHKDLQSGLKSVLSASA
jgi:uncharacterized protein (TIGR01777 family)